MPHVYRSQNLILIQINKNENSKTCKMDPYFFYHQLYAFFFFPSYHSLLKKEIKIVYCIRPNKDLSSLVHNLLCGQQGRRKKQSGTDCISCNFIDLYLIIFFFIFIFCSSSLSLNKLKILLERPSHTLPIFLFFPVTSLPSIALSSLCKKLGQLCKLFSIFMCTVCL